MMKCYNWIVVSFQKNDITELSWTIPKVTKDDLSSSWKLFVKNDKGYTSVHVKLQESIPEATGKTPNKTHNPNESHILITDPGPLVFNRQRKGAVSVQENVYIRQHC
jgi:hypothetical protein